VGGLKCRRVLQLKCTHHLPNPPHHPNSPLRQRLCWCPTLRGESPKAPHPTLALAAAPETADAMNDPVAQAALPDETANAAAAPETADEMNNPVTGFLSHRLKGMFSTAGRRPRASKHDLEALM
jgi:hypothetical protein